MAAVLIAVALYVVENYGGNGFVPSWDQIYQWIGLEPSQSETTAPLPEEDTPRFCQWIRLIFILQVIFMPSLLLTI